ncbi:PepSY domain-containing protein [Brucella intermedia]|uniref:PepSY domain-containing protein n=1 Tax=Brucella intermedia TaxID=94625 RepID=A0A7V6U012_9HYPH|nr:PepSY domain-containing protein [Brucella intermedia]WGG61400.1 PepSY domain-containing protein [Brucella intermedia]HHV68468.1 PepSY domain-containing protein [Brucella intermedia]
MKQSIRYCASAVFLLVTPAAFAQTAAPSNDPQTPAVTTPGEKNPKAPVPGQNSFTEDQVKERLTEEGYTNIMHLQLGEDGVWRADAARNGQPVKVLFDFQGNITTQ